MFITFIRRVFWIVAIRVFRLFVVITDRSSTFTFIERLFWFFVLFGPLDSLDEGSFELLPSGSFQMKSVYSDQMLSKALDLLDLLSGFESSDVPELLHSSDESYKLLLDLHFLDSLLWFNSLDLLLLFDPFDDPELLLLSD